MPDDDFEESARLYETGQLSRRRFLTRLVAGGATVTAAYALMNATGPAAFAHVGRGPIHRPRRYGKPPRGYGNPPGHYGSPGQYGCAPGQYGHAPGQYGQPPKHYGQPPRHYGKPPRHYGNPPGHYGRPPRNGGNKWSRVGGRRR